MHRFACVCVLLLYICVYVYYVYSACIHAYMHTDMHTCTWQLRQWRRLSSLDLPNTRTVAGQNGAAGLCCSEKLGSGSAVHESWFLCTHARNAKVQTLSPVSALLRLVWTRKAFGEFVRWVAWAQEENRFLDAVVARIIAAGVQWPGPYRPIDSPVPGFRFRIALTELCLDIIYFSQKNMQKFKHCMVSFVLARLG